MWLNVAMPYTKTPRRELAVKMYNEGKTVRQIAEALGGITTQRVYQYLVDAGIRQRERKVG